MVSVLAVACTSSDTTPTLTPAAAAPTPTATATVAQASPTPEVEETVAMTPAVTETPAPTSTATPRPTATASPTPVLRPTPLPDTLFQSAGAGLQLPEGFVAEVWLEGIRNPTAFSWDDQDRLYIATQGGDLLRVNDATTEEPPTDVVVMADGISFPLGLAFHDGALYISSRGEITRLADDDGEPDALLTVIGNLPARQHQNNGPAIGPDGRLYVPIGSTCDACIEEDARSAR